MVVNGGAPPHIPCAPRPLGALTGCAAATWRHPSCRFPPELKPSLQYLGLVTCHFYTTPCAAPALVHQPHGWCIVARVTLVQLACETRTLGHRFPGLSARARAEQKHTHSTPREQLYTACAGPSSRA